MFNVLLAFLAETKRIVRAEYDLLRTKHLATQATIASSVGPAKREGWLKMTRLVLALTSRKPSQFYGQERMVRPRGRQ
jgi:hypothetical protein